MSRGTAAFLDTSIQIARVVHSPETKKRIAARVEGFDFSITSDVVRQEFKRRLLKEAQYLLNQLDKRQSYVKVLRHVIDVLPPQQGRKRNICLELLGTILEDASDEELTERSRRYLRTLLRVGLGDFDATVDHVVRDAECACAKYPVEERVAYKRYEFGPDKCSRTGDTCGIMRFITSRRDDVERILATLRQIPNDEKSDELRRGEEFLEAVLADPSTAKSMEPCLYVGDILIALESAGVPTFYTLNGKESQHLCRALGQNLIVRPKNPKHEDVFCLHAAPEWPGF